MKDITAETESKVKTFAEMTKEEIQNLPRCVLTMRQIKSNRSPEPMYRATAEFAPNLRAQIKGFDESTYNFIGMIYDKVVEANRGQIVLSLPCVITKGTTIKADEYGEKKKYDYYSYDILAFKGEEGDVIRFHDFFDSMRRRLIKYGNMDEKLHVIDRGETDKTLIPDNVFSDNFSNNVE